MKRNDPPETQEAGERENGHPAVGNSHAPAFRGGMRDSASGIQKRWVAGFRPQLPFYVSSDTRSTEIIRDPVS
jgi:hypothetical protein